MSSSYIILPESNINLYVSIYSNTETSLAMSTLAIWCRVVMYRDFSAPIFSVYACFLSIQSLRCVVVEQLINQIHYYIVAFVASERPAHCGHSHL